METKKRKKKGRPSKTSTLHTPGKPLNYDSIPAANRRSAIRNPNSNNFDEFDDDDERKETKVKLVVRLPRSEKNSQKNESGDYDSGSGLDSDSDSEDREAYAKKREINAVDDGSSDAVANQKEEAVKATDYLHESPLESGPTSTTPLPDKKLLVFILERLQKKDTHGVFSEPVDPNELPDYHEIIKQPMDFGTVKKKLAGGAYKYLEELEADVFLICSNAMEYNSSDTIYHRQARSIQEIAKRDIGNLRHEGDDGEPQPKVVRRGRPPGKSLKKSLETSPIDTVAPPEISSGATLARGEKIANGLNPYNLRKASPSYRYRPNDPYLSSYRPRSGENYSEWLADWNDEFPASILRADMKYGKKQFTVDENRRDTYREFHPLSCGNGPQGLFNSSRDGKHLVPVGLQEPLSYARSLARYAANLGPVSWKIASKKIEAILPAGVQYGPGRVGENVPPLSNPISFSNDEQKSPNSNTAGDSNSRKIVTPSTSDLSSAIAPEGMVEAVRKLNSQNDETFSWRTQFKGPQKPFYHPRRNGLNEMLGYDLSNARIAEMGRPVSTNDQSEEAKLSEYRMAQSSWQALSMQKGHNLSIPPDLNVRIQAVGSPSSSLQIGSPQQPDLALQL